MRSFSQAGGQAGTSFNLKATSGTNLDELATLISTHPGITARFDSSPRPFTDQPRRDEGNLVVSIQPDVPPGRYEISLVGRHGVSNPRAFIVTRHPFEVVSTVSHSFEAPTPLKEKTLSQAKATPAEIDYYEFPAVKGESYKVDLACHRIDSRMIGQITLFDPNKRQVMLTRGSDESDASLTFRAKTEGTYRLAIHDFTYRGGDEFPYQIIVQSIDGTRSEMQTSAGPNKWLSRAASVSDDLTWQLESSAASGPQRVDIPLSFVGHFPEDPTDTVFQFSASKDELLVFELISHRVGQPTDARLMVQKIESAATGDSPPKLKTLLNTDDSQAISDGAIQLATKDPVGLLKIPETGDYQMVLRDLDVGRSLSNQQSFQIHVRPANPRFDLVAYRVYPHKDVNASQPAGSKLFRGGSEVIRVMVIRQDGWSGPIQVNVEELPPGVNAKPAIIAANQTQTQITLTANENAAKSVRKIRVVGQSVDGSFKATAKTAILTWGKGAGRDFIRSRLTDQFLLAVSEVDVSPLTIDLGNGEPIEVKKGQAIGVPVKLIRRDGGKANVVLRARDFPPGANGADLTIAADATDGTFQVKTGNTPPGTYSLWLQAETKIKVKPNPQRLERAQAYRAQLQSLQEDPARAAELEAIKAAIVEADKAIEAAKALAADRELTVYFPTSNATLRVVEP
ncbi:MAG: hypothetical protein AAGG48_20450 [Planctomycetota bacterium]